MWIYSVVLLGLCALQGSPVGALRCFVCDTASAQNYAAANTQCNQQGEVECADKRSTACMLEGYMQPNNQAQVVKRCVLKCPVFINTTAEVVRCCPKPGCNEALDHRPPPRSDITPPLQGGGGGRYPPGSDGPGSPQAPGGGDRDMMEGGPYPGAGRGMEGDAAGSPPWAGDRGAGPNAPGNSMMPGGGDKDRMPPPRPGMPGKDGPMPRDMMKGPGSAEGKPAGENDVRPGGGQRRPPDGAQRTSKGGSSAKSGMTDELSGSDAVTTHLTGTSALIAALYILLTTAL